jgi:FdhE protein
MSLTQASALLTPEQIAVQAGQQAPALRLPERATLFAERALRLRQLAAGHAMRDFLLFTADLADAQHAVLQAAPALALPDEAQLADAARAGLPPLPALAWPRDPAWHGVLHTLVAALATVQALRQTDGAHLERQADRLLRGMTIGLDLAAAPLVAAALQVTFTQLVLATEAAQHPGTGRLAPFGRIDNATTCPCCGSAPTASIARIGGDAGGYRYLHCSLCGAQWHMVRIKCSHCESTKGIAYQSLAPLDAAAPAAAGARPEAVQAETCDECGHYLKIVHMARDAHVEPVADDLASLTLDLLVGESGYQHHGVNLLLLFGEPDAEPDPAAVPPPDPGAA